MIWGRDGEQAVLSRVAAPLRLLSNAVSRLPLLSSVLAIGGGYWLGDLGWREAVLAMLAFGMVAALLRGLAPVAARKPLLIAWAVIFSLDLGIKSFLISVYQTKPDAVLIIDALGNTSPGETREFIEQYWRLIGQYFLEAGLYAALLIFIISKAASKNTPRWLALLWLLLFVGLQLNPTFRRANPLYFWPKQLLSYNDFQKRLLLLADKRVQAQAKLPQWQPTYTGSSRDTVVVVLGESTSRWDWQLYGYTRNTTPELMVETRDALVFRDAISGAGGTIASFRLMLTPLELRHPVDDEAEPSVVMLAKAAGYKTFWISNQQDRYINPRFADEADVVHLLNVGGGRNDRDLDEDVLPAWHEALDDPAPRKMIVVHLLGAHPHYEMRSPPQARRFHGIDDAVTERLKRAGRNAWVRYERNAYDDAMLYQDHIIAGLLRDLKANLGGSDGAFLFTSDHAQEVGHTRNFAGHSGEEAGQVVPLLIWTSPALPPELAREAVQRPYQTDRLDWTLLDMLHIKTRYDQPGDSLLSADYRPHTRYLVNTPNMPYTPSVDPKRP